MKEKQHTVIARSYATALFNASHKQGTLQRLREEAKVLGQLLTKKNGEQTHFLYFLMDPQQATESKVEMVRRVMKTRFSPLMVNLINGAIVRDRARYLPSIMEVFLQKIEEAEGIFHARVESAHELTFQEKLQLKKALESYTKAKLNIDYEINPDLIGGLVFRFKDVLIDGSLRRELKDLGNRLMRTQVLG
jgi:F-type H+-transporting ATPase subunit delta